MTWDEDTTRIALAGAVALVLTALAALFIGWALDMHDCEARGGVSVRAAMGNYVCVKLEPLP